MTGAIAFSVAVVAGLVFFVLHTANAEQNKYDACWARGGVQVKTVKFSNGTACIDRSALLDGRTR